MKKTLLFIGLLALLASCSNYRVEINHLNGTIDTITTDSRNLEINFRDQLRYSCGCKTIAYNVKSYSVLYVIPETKEEKKDKRIFFLLFFGIIASIAAIILYVKSKNSIMKNILKYIAYGVTIVLTFKIGMILIDYLPKVIESIFK